MEQISNIEQTSNKKKKDIFLKRIHEIDFARGLLIIIVMIDHLIWNFKYYGQIWWGGSSWVYGAANFYWTSTARAIIQPLALMAFCFISGISCSFSRNNKKRALIAIIFWAVIFLFSNLIQIILESNQADMIIRVDLNIIGVLDLSMGAYCLVEKRSWKILLACIIFGFLVSQYLSPSLREILVKACGGWSNTRTGVNYGKNGTPKFYMPLFWEYPEQADFVPLFPYIVVFFLGAFVSYFVYKEKRQSIFPHRYEWERPVCFLGRHTLIIYLAHFIIMRGIFMIINLIVTGGIA